MKVDIYEVTKNYPVKEQALFVIGALLPEMRSYFQQHGQFVGGHRFRSLSGRFGHSPEHVRGIGFIKGKVFFVVQHQEHKHANHPPAEIFHP